MIVKFSSPKLEKSIIDKATRNSTYGELSKIVKMRYDMLIAAVKLGDISHKRPPRRHKLSGKLSKYHSITVKKGLRFWVVPINYSGSELSATEILIDKIKDYH